MPIFKISEGPWERLFEGKFQEHDVEFYMNPAKIMMVVVFEKKLDRVEGAIIELYKVFHSIGEAESFTETLPREVLLVTKHDEKQTMKFLLLGSKPSYVKWTEQEFIKEVDSLIKRLLTSSKMIKDVSKAYELTLEEIAEASPEVQSAFFTQPMMVPLLSTSSHFAPGEEPSLKGITKGEIVLGMTRDRKKVVEPFAFFTKVFVSGGEPKDRDHVLRIITEGALLSGITSIIFDWHGSFSGIGEAGRNSEDLQKYEVNIDALGFPAKSFIPGESFRIDLNLLSTEGFAELLGAGEKNFPKILATVISREKVSSMQQLIEKISEFKQSEEFTEFEVLKTARIMKLVDIMYPGLFGGPNPIEEIVSKGNQSIARASLMQFSPLDERPALLLGHSLLKGIVEFFRKAGKTSSLRALLVIPGAQKLIPSDSKGLVVKEMLEMLKQAPDYGCIYALATAHTIDVDEQARNDATASINIVSGNDISVQLKNRKAYRVLARPALSRE